MCNNPILFYRAKILIKDGYWHNQLRNQLEKIIEKRQISADQDQGFFASISKIFILVEGMGTRLSFSWVKTNDVVKRNFLKTPNSLKILWKWLSAKFSFAFYVFVDS